MPRMGGTPGTIGRRARRRHARGGFSLIELLTAMFIFITVMSGVMLLFSGAIRATKQGFQNQDAFEIARGAMDILERDLSRSFTSRDHGDVYNFYGTPIGFTFVGMVTADESSSPNLARVTYVIHQLAAAQSLEAVPFDDDDDTRRETFALLRFIEPGGEDLESFPVDWTTKLPDSPGITLQSLIQSAVSSAGSVGPCDPGDITCLQEIEKAMKRELWIRMLSGDEGLPNIWSLLGLDPEDFVVAENILNVDHFTGAPLNTFPVINSNHAADLVGDYVNSFPGAVFPRSVFFTYREFGTRNRKDDDENFIPKRDPFTGEPLYADPPTNSIPLYETEVAPIELAFWNDRRNIEYMQFREDEILTNAFDEDDNGVFNNPEEAYGINLGSPLDARLPIEITANFTLFFESPYVGAPDFNRKFTMRIDLPTGYRRTFETPVAQ